MDAWIDFAIVGCAALLLFIVCAFTEKRGSDALRILLLGIPLGTALGLLSDFVLSGTYTYPLGYGVPYLILNAAVVYGFFTATVLLLQRAPLLRFCIWILAMIAAYEIPNHFFPVWTYEVTPFLGWLSFVLVGFFATAGCIALVSHFCFRYRFRCISDLARS